MNNRLNKLLIEAIICFDVKANELIRLMANIYNLDLSAENPFGKLLTRRDNLWKGELINGWKYRFHGGSCEFENVITGQILDIYINRNNQFGAIDNFFLYRFIETTKELDYVKSELNSKEKFYKALNELEQTNILVDIGNNFFPIRILNYNLIND